MSYNEHNDDKGVMRNSHGAFFIVVIQSFSEYASVYFSHWI